MRKKERSLRSLDMRRTLLVTLPFAGALAFWQAYDGIIPLILRDTFHLGDTLAGAVMALDNVCALFLLPFLAASVIAATAVWDGVHRLFWLDHCLQLC